MPLAQWRPVRGRTGSWRKAAPQVILSVETSPHRFDRSRVWVLDAANVGSQTWGASRTINPRDCSVAGRGGPRGRGGFCLTATLREVLSVLAAQRRYPPSSWPGTLRGSRVGSRP
jgi:hypothetical protein